MGWRGWRRADAQARDAAPTARRASAGDDGDAARADPTAALRVRARRRLIGAAALLLAVAVALPMLLDKEPRPVPDAIPIDIPSDKTPFSPRLALPPQDAASAPIVPPPDAAPAEESRREPAPKAERTEAPDKPVDKSGAKSPAKPSGAATAKATDRAAEEKRARDLLEGESTVAGAAAPATTGKYLLQAAALGSESAARELVERLKKQGFASFTERADTKDGVRFRVRLGPYATRDEAERVRARLRAMGISASVVAG
jgi:DedD protein